MLYYKFRAHPKSSLVCILSWKMKQLTFGAAENEQVSRSVPIGQSSVRKTDSGRYQVLPPKGWGSEGQGTPLLASRKTGSEGISGSHEGPSRVTVAGAPQRSGSLTFQCRQQTNDCIPERPPSRCWWTTAAAPLYLPNLRQVPLPGES